MNQETLAIYAQDLSSFEFDDVAAVLDAIGKEAPEDYKQLWPAIGTLEKAIRERIRARRPSMEQEAADRWLAYIAAAKAEGVTEPDAEILAQIEALNGKHSLTKPKVIDTTPVMLACPHCSQELPVGPNIRFWTPEELRSYADVLERNQTIAAANRAAMMEQQAEPADEPRWTDVCDGKHEPPECSDCYLTYTTENINPAEGII